MPLLMLTCGVECRFIGRNLQHANATFRQVVIYSLNSMAPNSTYDIKFRPGVQAPIVGPDGLNGSGRAYAPSPGLGTPPPSLPCLPQESYTHMCA